MVTYFVSATNFKTLQVTGTGLKNLNAENITIDGNKVASVSSTDGKTATVVFENGFLLGKETVVKFKSGDETKEFKFTYDFTVSSVSVDNQTFDDDAANQKVTLRVNNEVADLDYLAAAGYSVEFRAFDNTGAAANDDFFGTAGATTASTTGELAGTVPTGDYTVQVTVTKGSTILTSEKANIKVLNLDSAAASIAGYELTNNTLGTEQNSTTLFVGETAEFTELTVSTGSASSDITTGMVVSSDNSGVVSVTESGGTYTLNAEGTGTAKVTVKYGKLEKVITFTVTGTPRSLDKVTASNVTVIKGKTVTKQVVVTDQYGDPISAATADIVETVPSYLAPVNVVAGVDGKATITVDATSATAAANGVIYFKDAYGTTLGTLNVKVTNVDNTENKVLEVVPAAGQSDDNVLDFYDDNVVTYQLGLYTSENVENGVHPITGYTVKFNKDIVSIDGDTDGEVTLAADSFDITAVAAGKTDVSLFDADGNFVAKVTITVEKASNSVTGINWKSTPNPVNSAQVINYKTVLDVESSTEDDILKGVTLKNATPHKVRMTTSGDVYVDANDNGQQDATPAETTLGTITGSITADSDIAAAFGADVTAGVSVASGDKGTVVFTFTKPNGTVLPTKQVNVNIK